MLTKRFTFLCDKQELAVLETVAKHLKRSRGDTIRFLLYAASQELDIDPAKNPERDFSDGIKQEREACIDRAKSEPFVGPNGEQSSVEKR
jgi:hypothetical protein